MNFYRRDVYHFNIVDVPDLSKVDNYAGKFIKQLSKCRFGMSNFADAADLSILENNVHHGYLL